MEKICYFYKKALNLKPGINNSNKCNGQILDFDDRKIVEDNDHLIQPICAGVILTKTGKILSVNKTDKSTGKISPEKGKTLLYVGGHLSLEDFVSNTISKNFKQCMAREIKEELNIDILKIGEIIKTFAVYSPVTPKSAKHFGVMHTIILEEEFEPHFIDGKAKFIDINEAKSLPNLEDWSNYLINEI